MRGCSDGGRSQGGERGVMVCWWRRERERGKRTKSVVVSHICSQELDSLTIKPFVVLAQLSIVTNRVVYLNGEK
ncbi:hypothetical protein YC2023_038451 [Brassica napus]